MNDDLKTLTDATKTLEEILSKLKAGDLSALNRIKGLGDTMEKVIPALERQVKSLRVQKRAQDIVEGIDRRVRRHDSLTPDFAEPKFTVLAKTWRWCFDDEPEWPLALILAEFVYDHIEIHFGGWTEAVRDWKNYAHVFNHEVLHGIIGRIEAEDDLEHADSHFPMLCGLDEMFGFSMGHTNPEQFLPPKVVVEEALAFGDSHFSPIRRRLGDGL